jgi:P27 family predicted phage terminase small subunit
MSMGRPPKPIEQRRLEGNLGKRPLPEPLAILPVPESEIPDPPKGLKEPGKSVWLRLWSIGRAWLSTETNYDIMARLCEAHNERKAIQKEIKKHGYLVDGKLGGIVGNPAVTQLRQLEALMTRWESECGFTPVSRTRLGLAEVQRVSKLDAFLSKHSEMDPA